MVCNTRLGVYHARYYRYLDVAKHILERYPSPSGVSEELDTWWQEEFLVEMKKWVDEPQKLPFAPSYDAAVDELATLITEKVEDGMQWHRISVPSQKVRIALSSSTLDIQLHNQLLSQLLSQLHIQLHIQYRTQTYPIHLEHPLNSNIKNVLNPNNQTPPLRLPHHHNIHTLPPGTLEPLPPPRDDNSRGDPSPR
ncbi:hypothetical protein AnigIFM49718_002815 [Aspergillus niger]|nr:hypothetical protein AnigIFM49718_002815 [Aspergillus niger]